MIKTEQINETTRKFPRTMREAFGPGEHVISEEKIHRHDFIVFVASIIAAFACSAILIFWG